MAKIIITLSDEENGHVRIETKPRMDQLTKTYRAGASTPALQYAMLGLARMMKESEQIQDEQDDELRDKAIASASKLLLKDNRKIVLPDNIH